MQVFIIFFIGTIKCDLVILVCVDKRNNVLSLFFWFSLTQIINTRQRLLFNRTYLTTHLTSNRSISNCNFTNIHNDISGLKLSFVRCELISVKVCIKPTRTTWVPFVNCTSDRTGRLWIAHCFALIHRLI